MENESKRTEFQEKVFKGCYDPETEEYLTIVLRFDDHCGNGHNTFSMTAHNRYMGGCLHDYIVRAKPELKRFVKWHLCSTDGPMHYIANTLYWRDEGNLEYARKSAVWPDAQLEDLFKVNLISRLPSLLKEFRKDMESLGFKW